MYIVWVTKNGLLHYYFRAETWIDAAAMGANFRGFDVEIFKRASKE